MIETPAEAMGPTIGNMLTNEDAELTSMLIKGTIPDNNWAPDDKTLVKELTDPAALEILF